MCRLADYHCTDCGTLIHEKGLCEACQKEQDMEELLKELDLQFDDMQVGKDDEYDAWTDYCAEMRSLGMGR